jgi:hypothetical protein
VTAGSTDGIGRQMAGVDSEDQADNDGDEGTAGVPARV